MESVVTEQDSRRVGPAEREEVRQILWAEAPAGRPLRDLCTRFPPDAGLVPNNVARLPFASAMSEGSDGPRS